MNQKDAQYKSKKRYATILYNYKELSLVIDTQLIDFWKSEKIKIIYIWKKDEDHIWWESWGLMRKMFILREFFKS